MPNGISKEYFIITDNKQWWIRGWGGGGESGHAPPPQSGHGTHCGQLILTKISKTGAIRCQILRLKCTKFDFRWGSDPIGELTALPQIP